MMHKIFSEESLCKSVSTGRQLVRLYTFKSKLKKKIEKKCVSVSTVREEVGSRSEGLI